MVLTGLEVMSCFNKRGSLSTGVSVVMSLIIPDILPFHTLSIYSQIRKIIIQTGGTKLNGNNAGYKTSPESGFFLSTYLSVLILQMVKTIHYYSMFLGTR